MSASFWRASIESATGVGYVTTKRSSMPTALGVLPAFAYSSAACRLASRWMSFDSAGFSAMRSNSTAAWPAWPVSP